MTDEDLTGAGEARERARLLLARAAARRAAGRTPEPTPAPGPLERGGCDGAVPPGDGDASAVNPQTLGCSSPRSSADGARGSAGGQSPEGWWGGSLGAVGESDDLHSLLCDLAAYLGDRPQKDRDAMGLYGRVMTRLGEGER